MTAAALEAVRSWFRREARVFPWSATNDSYAIWISEVMLQQTVVTAAVAPFEAWMARWPDVASLAAAEEDDVLRAWEGLGYASRAKNLHRAAQVLAAQGMNHLPDDEASLRALPGVGEYTAASVLSFAFHQPALTLDANLKRVFQRLDAVPEWDATLEARWRQIWGTLVDGPASRESNQAIMQLGQKVCRAKNPVCAACPLALECRAGQEGLTAAIPAPRERTTIERATTVVLWHRPGPLWFLAHPSSGRFSNLWLAPPADAAPRLGRPLAARVHTYTKYRDRLSPFVAPWDGQGNPPLPLGWVGRWVTVDQAQGLGMISVYRKILGEATLGT